MSTGIQVKVSVRLGKGGSYEAYEGPYTAEPDFAGQTLPTKGKVMQDDVTVQPIAVASVSNTAGGRTIYIGGVSNA